MTLLKKVHAFTTESTEISYKLEKKLIFFIGNLKNLSSALIFLRVLGVSVV